MVNVKWRKKVEGGDQHSRVETWFCRSKVRTPSTITWFA